jgi:hypothetical protein
VIDAAARVGGILENSKQGEIFKNSIKTTKTIVLIIRITFKIVKLQNQKKLKKLANMLTLKK